MTWSAVRAERTGIAPRPRSAASVRALFGALSLVLLAASPAHALDEPFVDDAEPTIESRPADAEQAGSAGAAAISPATETNDEEAPQPWETKADVETSLHQVLGESRFRFCNESGYRLWPEQKRTYCPLAKDIEPRCKELAKACLRPAWGEDEPPPKDDDDISFAWLRSLGGLVRVLFWAVLAFVVFVILRALARHLTEELRRRKHEERAPVLIENVPAPEAPRETNVDRLLERAKAEAARGEYAQALTSAHAAALHALEERGLVKVHRSRTNGDYLRQLGDHRTERDQMRRIVRDVESVQFGHDQANATTFTRVFGVVTALTGRVAVLCLFMTFAGLLTACDRPKGPEAPSSPTSPDGYGLLETLLQRHSKEAQRRVRKITEPPSEVHTFVSLSPDLRKEEWERVLSWVESGGTLVTAGFPPALLEVLDTKVEASECAASLATPGLNLRQEGAKAFSSVPGDSIVDCGNLTFLTEIQRGSGFIYAFADDAFLRNANLGTLDNAQVVVRIAAAPEGRVELLGPWTGSGTHDPFQTIHAAGLTPWLLQLFLLALCYAVYRGVRFGTPREPIRDSRRAFVEHAEALSTQYGKAKASGYALESYGRWAALRLRQRVTVRERDMHALAQAVARRTGADPMKTLKILVEAQSADQLAGDAGEHARTMNELARLLREVSGPK